MADIKQGISTRDNGSSKETELTLPPLALVQSWHEKALFGEHGRDFKEQAFAAYKKINHSISDKELLRFMPSRIDWKDFDYASLQDAKYEDLGSGVYKINLALFFQGQGTRNSDAQMRMLIVSLYDKVNAVLNEILTSNSPMQLLIAATYNRAHIVYVPADTQLLDIIDLAFNMDAQTYGSELLILIVEEGAQISLCDKQNVRNGIHMRLLTGLIGNHARVTIVSDQEYGTAASGLQLETWLLGQQSHLTSIAGLTGGKQTWSFKDFKMEGATACVEHLSLAALKGKEQAALITRQQHKAPKSKSSVQVKTLLLGEAHSFYRGTITMNEMATQSEADQQQRALILSPLARTCAIPSLEVATHDVRCRHGSAAGRFNKEELWYLQSRGFDGPSAYALLIDGFYNEHPLVQEHSQLLNSMLCRMKKQTLLL